jgi:acetyl-CoA carboxylase biotin carboxyl carrier protein
MELNEIQSLIKFVSKAGVSEVQIEQDGFKIVIKTPASNANETVYMPQVPVQVAVPQTQFAPAPAATIAASQPEQSKNDKDAAPAGNFITVKSPMIGTFYRSPGPDKAPFVNVGDEVKKGSVLCIIEAMKLFNEIESEYSGKIVKVLVDDASPVEYDQPLFLIEPK